MSFVDQARSITCNDVSAMRDLLIDMASVIDRILDAETAIDETETTEEGQT